MATAAPWEELSGTAMEVAVLVEDGWQRQGLGSQLLRRVIQESRYLGADRVVCMVQPENDGMLRTVEGLRMRTRVVQDGGHLMVTVALSDQSLSHAVDRPPVQYRQVRATPPHRSQPTRSAGQPAREHALDRKFAFAIFRTPPVTTIGAGLVRRPSRFCTVVPDTTTSLNVTFRSLSCEKLQNSPDESHAPTNVTDPPVAFSAKVSVP